jgi:hypothetical protein
MTLINKGMSRSALEIAKGATLNLYVSEGKKLTVDSGYGVDGKKISGTITADDTKGGAGGYAGIHVPEGATLNLTGEGTIYAYGGNAGAGGTGGNNSLDWGAAGGGRSRSWNWWKRWHRWRRNL